MTDELLHLEIKAVLLKYSLNVIAWYKEPVKLPDNSPDQMAEECALIIEKMVKNHGK